MNIRQTSSARTIGYTVTHYWCRECVPEGVSDYYPPMREGEDFGVPYHCDQCDAQLVPCEHEWEDWHSWYAGGEFRACKKDGCREIDRR